MELDRFARLLHLIKASNNCIHKQIIRHRIARLLLYGAPMPTPEEKSLFVFGTREWTSEPELAFDSFLTGHQFQGRNLRESSFTIYRGMFRRLTEWAMAKGWCIFDLTEARLETFLAERELSAETRHRYLLVFTTLFAHLAQIKAGDSHSSPADVTNPARVLLMEHEAPERDEPEHLSPTETSRFIAALPKSENWKVVRSRAMVFTLLGTGMRSSELLEMKTTDILRKQGFLESIWIPAHKPRPSRQVPMHAFTVSALEVWLNLRTSIGVCGNLVFPANLRGAPLTPVTLFRLIKDTLHKAEVPKRYEGATLLRNTCGALWLQSHQPPEVMQWMGHTQQRTTELLLPLEKRSRHA